MFLIINNQFLHFTPEKEMKVHYFRDVFRVFLP